MRCAAGGPEDDVAGAHAEPAVLLCHATAPLVRGACRLRHRERAQLVAKAGTAISLVAEAAISLVAVAMNTHAMKL